MSLLSIDFGKNRIGLALSEGRIASPYGVISTKSWKKKLKEIVINQKIDEIIIGISESKFAEETKKFAKEVIKVTGKKIKLWDETLTTNEAIKKMILSGRSKKFRKEREDAIAAALILQSYIDSNK